ncbi:MAG: hypothetical protein C4547_11430 [Phycisphaerales bacterium]|nr:MAG: hypothetical protein C4547_11430 [Phycisphaerales bacterium]
MGAVTAAFAMITSKTDSPPPFRYAAEQATMDADGVWTQVGGGVTYNGFVNVREIATLSALVPASVAPG